jgi:hypothetical protein
MGAVRACLARRIFRPYRPRTGELRAKWTNGDAGRDERRIA